MKRSVLGTLLAVWVLLVAIPVSAISPHEALRNQGRRTGSFQCAKGETIGIIDSIDSHWKFFLNAKNGNVVVMQADDGQNVIRVYFGTVRLAGRDDVTFTLVYDLDPERAKLLFPHPCDFLIAKEM